MKKEDTQKIFDKWIEILRMKNSWDVKLEFIDNDDFKKTGDFKVDIDDRKAIILLNERNPKNLNFEEVIVHELLHLKLYPLDQLTEGLIDAHYENASNEYNLVYGQFMTMLEQTVGELARCFLLLYGDDKRLSYGRCEQMTSFNELYDGLKSMK